MSLAVARNAGVLREPFLCYLAFARRPDSRPSPRRQPLGHPAGVREVTGVELVLAQAGAVSAELPAVTNANLVKLRQGPEYLLEISFDGKRRAQKKDFRPALPLIFRW